jgi:hypothetical protein
MVIPKFVCFIEDDCAIKPILFGGIFQFNLWGSGVVVDLTLGIIGTQPFLSLNVKLIYIPCNIEKKAFVNSIISYLMVKLPNFFTHSYLSYDW